MEKLFYAVWRDIPQEDNGFANNLMQAMTTMGVNDGYSRDLLLECENRVSAMLRDCLPAARQHLADESSLLSHILFMAQDGFVINYRINGPSQRMDAMVDAMCDLLMDDRPELDG